MKKYNFNTLESFIATIGPIDEGKRNETLYRVGHRLRRELGLHGACLLQPLHDINAAKCSPPLEDGEVEAVAASVDKSNVPIGSLCRSVEEYLSKEISLFPSATDSTPNGRVIIRQSGYPVYSS